VAADNTALYLLAPKTDLHGLGFDPFKVRLFLDYSVLLFSKTYSKAPLSYWVGGGLLWCSKDPAALSPQVYCFPPQPPTCLMHLLSICLPQGAEDFRRLKEQEREAQRPGQGAGKKRHRGIAFGSGGDREADTEGVGTA
jgi:hypothetical protein